MMERMKKKKMRFKDCCVVNCKSSKKRRPDLVFFRFPPCPETSKKWVIALGRSDFEKKTAEQLCRTYTVCELHFEPQCFRKTKRKLLKSAAVPTLFKNRKLPLKQTQAHSPPKPRHCPSPPQQSNESFEVPTPSSIINTSTSSAQKSKKQPSSMEHTEEVTMAEAPQLRKLLNTIPGSTLPSSGHINCSVCNKMVFISCQADGHVMIILEASGKDTILKENTNSSHGKSSGTNNRLILQQNVSSAASTQMFESKSAVGSSVVRQSLKSKVLSGNSKIVTRGNKKAKSNSIAHKENEKSNREKQKTSVSRKLSQNLQSHATRSQSARNMARKNNDLSQNSNNKSSKEVTGMSDTELLNGEYISRTGDVDAQENEHRLTKNQMPLHNQHGRSEKQESRSLKPVQENSDIEDLELPTVEELQRINSESNIEENGPNFCQFSKTPDDTTNPNPAQDEESRNDQLAKKKKRKHTKVTELDLIYMRCELCNSIVRGKYGINMHMKNHIDGKTHKCETCGKFFGKPHMLKSHIRKTHEGWRPFACETCGKSYHSKHALRNHVNARHLGLFHLCPLCGMAFYYATNLRRHLMHHSGEKPFSCRFCGKSFNQKSGMQTHEMKHTGERPLCCEICGKSFRQHHSLKDHLSTKHGIGIKSTRQKVLNKPYPRSRKTNTYSRPCPTNGKFPCELCDKVYSTPSGLYMHNRTFHQNLRPFACSLCPKTFTTKQNFTEHQTVHTGEKPYTCKVCGLNFNRRGNYRRHLKIHSEVSPFVCEHCGKGFRQKTNLTCHLNTHKNQVGLVDSKKQTVDANKLVKVDSEELATGSGPDTDLLVTVTDVGNGLDVIADNRPIGDTKDELVVLSSDLVLSPELLSAATSASLTTLDKACLTTVVILDNSSNL